MCPATPSSKPHFENSRKAPASLSFRWRRSSAGVAKTGGRGIRSIRDFACGIKSSLLLSAYYIEFQVILTTVSQALRPSPRQPVPRCPQCHDLLDHPRRSPLLFLRILVVKQGSHVSSAHSARTVFPRSFGALRLVSTCSSPSRAKAIWRISDAGHWPGSRPFPAERQRDARRCERQRARTKRHATRRLRNRQALYAGRRTPDC